VRGGEVKMKVLYSIVIPVFNGEKTIGCVCLGIDDVFNKIEGDYEIILVDDGSQDNSWEVMKQLSQNNHRIKLLRLMRNFGEHNAVISGLNYTRGEFVIVMDDDGQNPPEEIPKLITKTSEGYDVVFGNYKAKQHNIFRNIGSAFNNIVATLLLKKPRNLYLCSFKIICRPLVCEIIKYSGPYPYIDGLIFRCTRKIGTVDVQHRERSQGQSGYTLWKLASLSLNMFTNFSILPLRISVYGGIIFAVLGFIMSIIFIVEKFISPSKSMGWASLIVAILFFSGIQLFAIGMIGEYLGRLFLTMNKTPQFIVREKKGFN
jgi:undecaprenyl-phosphate 4-deoxy-4-formamido-L-arabinose transferase|tara:strand:+ start:208 stop:1158 length:951 start_codon:yes stop_codon:yes gene_type:complete